LGFSLERCHPFGVALYGSSPCGLSFAVVDLLGFSLERCHPFGVALYGSSPYGLSFAVVDLLGFSFYGSCLCGLSLEDITSSGFSFGEFNLYEVFRLKRLSFGFQKDNAGTNLKNDFNS